MARQKIAPFALARREGWEARLAVLIEARRHAPFKWGQHDCGLFAADAIEAVCGVDVAATLRGYHSAVGAARSLARHGLGDVGDVAVALGLPERQPIDARRGDVVSFRTELGVTLGVVLGERFAAPAEKRLAFYSVLHAARAWRIG